MDDLLLKDIQDLLWDIQHSRKGSMGTIDNVYLPQLSTVRVNELAVRVSAWIEDKFVEECRE